MRFLLALLFLSLALPALAGTATIAWDLAPSTCVDNGGVQRLILDRVDGVKSPVDLKLGLEWQNLVRISDQISPVARQFIDSTVPAGNVAWSMMVICNDGNGSYRSAWLCTIDGVINSPQCPQAQPPSAPTGLRVTAKSSQ